MSNEGRRIIVDRSEQNGDVVGVVHKGEEVAELHPPDEGGRAADRWDGRVAADLRGVPETTVLGTADDPPIDGALFYVDQVLDYLEGDE